MQKIRNLAFVTDFDGTITDDDFFQYVKEAFFDASALAPWDAYMNGKMTHFDALKMMYGSIRAPLSEMLAVVQKVHVEPFVVPTFDILHQAGIPIYITSAGCDYYIELLLGDVIKKYNIQLITNPSSYAPETGMKMKKHPANYRFYDHAVGISKAKIVEYLQSKGKTVIFAGDGPPDIDPARIADVVFARKILLALCTEENIKTEIFDTYENIYKYFDKILKQEHE